MDLFAGPGGLDVAAHRLGVPVVGVEWDEDACATRRAAGLPTVEGDVRRPHEARSWYRCEPADLADATVLAGGPPCQTYTVAGTGAGRRALEELRGLVKRMAVREDITAELAGLDDERTGLVLEPLRWALAAIDDGRAYEAVVLEQVPAALPVWEAVGEVLTGEGYSVAHGVLRAEEFGVPQTRRRAILIARRDGTAALPEATHRPYRKGVPRSDGASARKPWVSMGEVLDRPGPFVVVSNYGTGGDPRARGRRRSTEPAATVTGKISRNRVVGPDGVEEPRFSFSEAGRLQTFPADYPWRGRAVAQQIGNAIPPRLALHVLSAALGLGEEERDGHLAALDSATRGETSWAT
ncbi:DNA cytosine methyltransferase [Streptomyces taklimakanensis]|uniref:DNA cytosine methyltransferase n=1 Tax=Streptomyces taklimakanensis TaxID=2569853 RepID=UPI00308401BC